MRSSFTDQDIINREDKYESLVRRNRHDKEELFEYLRQREERLLAMEEALRGNLQVYFTGDYTADGSAGDYGGGSTHTITKPLMISSSGFEAYDPVRYFEGGGIVSASVAVTTAGDGTATLNTNDPEFTDGGAEDLIVTLNNTWQGSDTLTVTVTCTGLLGVSISDQTVTVTIPS